MSGAQRFGATSAERLRLRLGASQSLSIDDGDPVARVRELTDGGADYAFEAVGSVVRFPNGVRC